MAKLENLEKLKEHVNMDGDEVIAANDVISRQVKWAPEITALCTISTSMSIRRLLTIPEHTWNQTDLRICKQAIVEIERLKELEGSHKVTLALACLGVRKNTLHFALKYLDDKVNLVKTTADDKINLVIEETKMVEVGRVVERSGEPPIEVLHSLSNLDMATRHNYRRCKMASLLNRANPGHKASFAKPIRYAGGQLRGRQESC